MWGMVRMGLARVTLGVEGLARSMRLPELHTTPSPCAPFKLGSTLSGLPELHATPSRCTPPAFRPCLSFRGRCSSPVCTLASLGGHICLIGLPSVCTRESKSARAAAGRARALRHVAAPLVCAILALGHVVSLRGRMVTVRYGVAFLLVAVFGYTSAIGM